MKLGDNNNFQTPEWVMDIMIKEIPLHHRCILEPTPGAGNFVEKLKKGFETVMYPDEDYFDMTHYVEYHSIVGNPPFTPMQKGYDILFDCMERSDSLIMLMPWLTLINSSKRLEKIMEFGLKKIIHLPRRAFKGSRVQTCILVMEKGYQKNTIFDWVK